MNHDDPFDLDDHRRRTPTNRDRLLAAGVREVEAKRERQRRGDAADAEERADMIRRGCEFIGAETCSYGEAHRLRACDCEWLDAEHATTDLTLAWEAASGEGRVVS